MTARHTHPAAPHRGRPFLRVLLRRAFAVLQLLAVIATPPTLLLTLLGNPLDPPPAVRSPNLLTQQVEDRTLLWLLALLTWLLYTHLLASLTVEAVRQTRGRNLRLPLPGLLFGANTLLASHLIASLLLTPTAGAGTHGPTLTPAVVRTALRTAVSVPPAAQAVTGSVTAAMNGATAGATNGATAAAGSADLTPPPTLSAGGRSAGPIQCRVLPPAGRDHDTLWDIAERHLNDGTRWREIYQLNEDRLMPDGQRLTRARLIRPGWILTLPADAVILDVDRVPASDRDLPDPATAAAVGSSPTAHPRQDDAHSHTHSEADSGADAEPLAPRAAPAAAAPVAPHPGTEPVTAQATTSSTAARPAPGGQPNDATDTAAGQQSDQDNTTAALMQGTLALGAVALLTALTRRRKVAARRRPPGVRAARPSPDLLEAERRIREQARLAEDTAATIRLALLLASKDCPTAEVKVLWQHPDGSIEVCWTEPSATAAVPAPFHPTDRGWLLPADAHRLLFATRRNGQRRQDRHARLSAELGAAPDPCPLLLPVGSRDGSACLVNLEVCGLISLTSDEHQPSPDPGPEPSPHPDDATGFAPAPLPRELLGAWVHTLAGAPWAEALRTHLPHALAELGTGLPYTEVCEPITATPTRFGPEEAAQIHEFGSFAAARRRNRDLDSEVYELYAGYPIGQLPAAVLQAAAGRTHPLVVLLLEPHPDAQPWTLHVDGTLSIPGVAADLTPVRLDPATHQRLLRLLEHAQDPPHAAPDDPHRAQLRPECPPSTTPPALIDLDAGEANPLAGARTDEPAPAGADVPAVTAPRATPPATTEANATEQAEAVGPLEVGVLGPVTISGTDRDPPRQATLDLLAYMAFHRRPLRSREMWDGLWPSKPYNNQTLRSRRHELNQLIKPLLHRRAGGGYQLDELISTDWQRFQALADGNPAQQLAALALVRGRPFLHGDLDWFHLEGQLAEIEASIVDLALSVGHRALKGGDYDTARTAALAGLRGVPYEERLYRIAMQSAAARGAAAELHQLRQQLALVLQDELEPDDEMQPATAQLLDELGEHERKQQYLQRRREQP